MSEIHRRRGLALLGIVLLAEALLSLLPATTGAPTGAALSIHLTLTHSLLPAALATFMIAAFRRESFIPIAVRAAFVTLVGIATYDIVSQILTWGPGSAAFAFQPASMLLINLGAPILWASALARRDHPGDPALLRFGRLSAGMIQLGYVFQFVVRVRTWGAMASMGSGSEPASASGTAFTLASLLEIAADVLLLWASIDSVRSPIGPATVRSRARRIHRLMMWNVILFPAAMLLYHVSNYLRDLTWDSLGLWRLAIYPTMLVATTFVLALSYLLQFPASSSPLERSGGVESTGEPS